MRRAWKRIQVKLKSQAWVTSLIVGAIYWFMKLVNRTNPLVKGSHIFGDVYAANAPMIVALWHGQHLMTPFLSPSECKIVALLSRSADAEINAKIIDRLGFKTVRGSGGRNAGQNTKKGGARALLGLKKAVDDGYTAVMIADISKSTARQAGNGIILLAKLTGRPIVAGAYASSRRYVLKKSWDQTAISLPFGRAASVMSEPLYVEKDANDTKMENYRVELTRRLNMITQEAYRLADATA